MQQILTPTGYIPIDQATIGTLLLAYDVNTGEQITNEVLEIKYLTTTDEDAPADADGFIKINNTWTVYKNQSVWKASGSNYVVFHADELVIGDTIFNGDDGDMVITSLEETTGDGWWRLEVSNDSSYIVDNLTLHNASRYWVGGTGTWDNSTTTHWSGTTGGAGGSSVPGASDTVTLDGASGGGTVTLNYAPTITSITGGAHTGTFDTANNNMTMSGIFSWSGTGTRTLTLGTSTITITGSANWDITTTTNLTFSGASSTISRTAGQNSGFLGGGLTYGTVTMSGQLRGSNTFTTLTINGSNNAHTWVQSGTTNTISGTCTIAGSNDTSGTGMLSCATSGGQVSRNLTAYTINAATVSISNMIFIDGVFGGAGTWSGTNIGVDNCTGITGTTPVTRYWVGTTGGNWYTKANWGTGSGTGSGASVPLPQDTIIFDSNSITSAGRTITMNYACCPSIDFTNITNNPTLTCTLTNGTQYCLGDVTLKSGMTFNGTSQLIFNGSATQTFTTNGVAIGNTSTNGVNVYGVDVRLGDDMVFSGTNVFALTTGVFNANGKNLTIGAFSSSNSNTRTLTMGSGTWTITGNNATIWQTTTTTGMTITANTATIDFNYSGSTGTRTCTFVNPGNLNIIKVSAGSDTITFNGLTCTNMNFTGFTGIYTPITNSNTALGDVIYGTGMTTTSSSVSQTLSPTTAKTLTTNGVAINFPITINGVGGTVTLQDNLNIATSSRTLTLTNGTFNANNFNVTCGIFSSSNSNTRTLTMGSGTWTLTGNNGTIWTTSTTTGLTLNYDTAQIVANYSGSTGTRTLSSGGATFPIPNISFTGGTDTIVYSGDGSTSNWNSINFTGFAGALSANASYNTLNILGNVTLSSGMTITQSSPGGKTWHFKGTSAQTLTTKGINTGVNITVNGTSLTLNDALNATNLTSPTVFTLTAGTFNTQGFNVTSGTIISTASNTRALILGSGFTWTTWTVYGTGTISDVRGNSSSLTITQGNSIILISNTSASTKLWSSSNLTWGNLTVAGSGAGSVTISSGSGTNSGYKTITLSGPKTVLFTSSRTYDIEGFVANGTAGNLVTITSTTGGTPFTLSKTSGFVVCDYLSLQDSTATGGASFYAGPNSTNVSGNTGWFFTASPTIEISVSDNVTVTEALVYYPDTVYVREFVQMSMVDNVVSFEDVMVSENISLSIPLPVSVFDTVTITENVSIQTILPNVNDTVTVTENVSVKINTSISVYDQINVDESIVLSIPLPVSVFDTATITENITSRIISNPSIFDSVTITENVTLRLTTHLVIYDTVEVTEFTDFRVDIPLPLITDSVAVTEFVNVNQVYNIPVVDTLTVSENFAATNMIWVYEPQQFAPRGSSTTQNFWGAGDLEGEGYYGGSPFPSTPYRGGGGL